MKSSGPRYPHPHAHNYAHQTHPSPAAPQNEAQNKPPQNRCKKPNPQTPAPPSKPETQTSQTDSPATSDGVIFRDLALRSQQSRVLRQRLLRVCTSPSVSSSSPYEKLSMRSSQATPRAGNEDLHAVRRWETGRYWAFFKGGARVQRFLVHFREEGGV